MEQRPNIDADVLEKIVENQLAEHFVHAPEEDIWDIMRPLYKAGVFDTLEAYVRSEIESPSLKGPGPEWSS